MKLPVHFVKLLMKMTQTKQESSDFIKGKINDVVVYPLRKFVDERG